MACLAHFWPFQRRMKPCVVVPLKNAPTAQISVADLARTAFRTLSCPATFGLGTTVQAAPSQCSMSVWSGPPVSWSKPTAQASQGESTVTPLNSLYAVPGLGGVGPPQTWAPLEAWQAAADAAAGPRSAAVPASSNGMVSAGARRLARPRGRVLGSVIFSRLPVTGRLAL